MYIYTYTCTRYAQVYTPICTSIPLYADKQTTALFFLVVAYIQANASAADPCA